MCCAISVLFLVLCKAGKVGMDYLTKEQVDGLLEVFQAFDTSGNGVVSDWKPASLFSVSG